MEKFLRQYPNADKSKFFIREVNWAPTVWTKIPGYGEISATDPIFLSSEYRKWLGKPKASPAPPAPKAATESHKPFVGPKVGDLAQTPLTPAKRLYPIIFSGGGTIPEWPAKRRSKEDIFIRHPILPYPAQDLKVYVSGDDYFEISLPGFDMSGVKEKDGEAWDDSSLYYRVIFSFYCATYCCGVSTEHLEFSSSVHPMITSIMRYHIYFTTQRLLSRMGAGEHMKDISNEMGAERIYRDPSYAPRFRQYNIGTGKIHHTLRVWSGGRQYEDDYKTFIPRRSNGLTEIGTRYLQESVESYVWAITGAEASTRFPIVGKGASSLQTQEKFRDNVFAGIHETDPTVTLTNMRASVKDCNLTLNLALSRDIILIPSNLIILEKAIPGYNNTLLRPTASTVFGVNPDINFTGLPKPHKVQPDTHSSVPPHLSPMRSSTPSKKAQPVKKPLLITEPVVPIPEQVKPLMELATVGDRPKPTPKPIPKPIPKPTPKPSAPPPTTNTIVKGVGGPDHSDSTLFVFLLIGAGITMAVVSIYYRG